MRFFILVFSSILILTVSGCAKKANVDVDTGGDTMYLKGAKSIPSISSKAGTDIRIGRGYYPVPAKPNLEVETPNLVPPGSDLQRFNKPNAETQFPATQKKTPTKTARLSQNLQGQPVLLVAEPLKKSWQQLRTVLARTPYRLLDEDPSENTYYILDSISSGNKITDNTPIYRMRLHAKKSQTEIELLNQTGQPVSHDVATRVLAALKKRLG